MNSSIEPLRLFASGGSRLSPNAARLWRELGRLLALEERLVIITGGLEQRADSPGSPPADRTIVDGFLDGLRELGVKSHERVETFLPDPKLDWNELRRFEIGHINRLDDRSAQSRRFSMVHSADIVTSIEGEAGTRSVLDAALVIERPILPLPFGGGASAQVWREQRAQICKWFQIPALEANEFERVNLADLSEAETLALAARVRDCLMRAPEHKRNKCRVFISAKSADYREAHRVFEFLRSHGVAAFLSSESLHELGSTDFRKQIDQALDQAEHMVVVTSSRAHVEAPWVEAEWGFFINEKRSGRKAGNLITLVVGDLQIPELPPSLRQYEVLSLQTDALEKLLRYVAPPGADKRPIDQSTESTGRIRESSRLAGKMRPNHYLLGAGILIGLLVAGGGLYWAIHSRNTNPSAPETQALDPQFVSNRDAFLGALPFLHWIVYDPSESDPDQDRGASEASIRSDLQALRKHGFDGLITTTSKGTWQHIPRIAHEEGFLMVIAGIWELRNEEETNNALRAARFADAFCLGHGGLTKRYLFTDLEWWSEAFRTRTKRPVTTTASLVDYETDPRLAQFGDFIFPDAHTQWQKGKSPQVVWAETLELARRAARVAVAAQRKIVLLKMVSYPSGGAVGLTPQTQAEFYRLAVDEAKDRNDIPAGVTFSFMTAFDPVWKNDKTKWEEPEQYTGLFTRDRLPKPAVTEVTWRKPH